MNSRWLLKEKNVHSNNSTIIEKLSESVKPVLDKKREEILETDIGSRHYPGKTRIICKENISVVLKYLFKSKCRKVSYSFKS